MKNPTTDLEGAVWLSQLQHLYPNDKEAQHKEADKILISILISLGYQDTIREFNSIKKWYV